MKIDCHRNPKQSKGRQCEIVCRAEVDDRQIGAKSSGPQREIKSVEEKRKVEDHSTSPRQFSRPIFNLQDAVIQAVNAAIVR